MMAALAAREQGAAVTILEKNQRVGKKLLVTGNGRCNLTNMDLDIAHYHGREPRFARGALSRFDNRRTIAYFAELGIVHKVEDGGKVFPVSNQASSVLDVLRYELERTGVEVICEAEVKDIKRTGDGFTVYPAGGGMFGAGRVIIAAGGRAAPQLGAGDGGHVLARKLGHTIVEPFPALVQLKLAAGFLPRLKGIKFDGDVEIILHGQSLRRATGEILFTEYGISGPPVFDLSRLAGELLKQNERPLLKIVLINNLSRPELDQLLAGRFQSRPQKPLDFSFVGFLNKRLAPVLLTAAGVGGNKPAGLATAAERKKIAAILQDWRFEISGTRGWQSAQVTAGGVDVAEVDPRTMESKIVPGLYFAGEVLDIDGDCGGYNLQWAWSSGRVAGENAAGQSSP
ncbi:flavoprotein [Desulfotomaculum copahuensis]|uniref:Flavoprotein n=2 Tax=Desulfotomaculum copahuensis TaxID=1838280 RepID=A0A1B7LL01_9FIRM|nr:flavoprotein [Desulfotomaculum copahuensis]